AMFHILNHATFKASLFMAAGIVDHETGTRDMRRLGGLRRIMPYTSALAIIASLAMAGIPLLNGFLSKEMFFAQALEIEGHEEMRWFITIAAFLFATFGVAYSLRFVHDTFLGSGPRAVENEVHEPPRFMQVPVAILVVACMAVGIAPQWTIGPFLQTAARGVLGDALPEYSLAVWHGINTPLLMSLGGVVCGVLLYLGLNRVLDLHAIVRQSQARRLAELHPHRRQRQHAAQPAVAGAGGHRRGRSAVHRRLGRPRRAHGVRRPANGAPGLGAVADAGVLRVRHPGAVPPPPVGGAGDGRLRPGGEHDLRGAVGARPRAHPAAGGAGDGGADAAGPALPAQG